MLSKLLLYLNENNNLSFIIILHFLFQIKAAFYFSWLHLRTYVLTNCAFESFGKYFSAKLSFLKTRKWNVFREIAGKNIKPCILQQNFCWRFNFDGSSRFLTPSPERIIDKARKTLFMLGFSFVCIYPTTFEFLGLNSILFGVSQPICKRKSEAKVWVLYLEFGFWKILFSKRTLHPT